MSLLYIASHNPCHKQAIEEDCSLTTASSSRMIDLLADGYGRKGVMTPGLGLITKYTDPGNKRRHMCKLTPKGEQLVHLIKNHHLWMRSRHGNKPWITHSKHVTHGDMAMDKTARINCNHFTRLRGSSFPIKDQTNRSSINGVLNLKMKGSRMQLSIELYRQSRTVLNHCAFDGLIDAAPKFRRRKESEGRVLWYTKDEVDKLSLLSTDVFMRDDLKDIILFAAYTGMRQGEILKIRRRTLILYLTRFMLVVYLHNRPRQRTGELSLFMTRSWTLFTIVVHNHRAVMCSYSVMNGVTRINCCVHSKRSIVLFQRRILMYSTPYDTVTQHGSLRQEYQSGQSWLCADTSVSRQHYDMQRLQMQHSRTRWLLSERD